MDACRASSLAAAAAAAAVSVSPPSLLTFSTSLFSLKPRKTNLNLTFTLTLSPHRTVVASASTSATASTSSASTSYSSHSPSSTFGASENRRRWSVSMDAPQAELDSRSDVINYYVDKLQRVLGNERDAQMCIYNASCGTPFGFCCDIDEDAARELARVPGVLAVRPDPDNTSESPQNDYSKNPPSYLSNQRVESPLLFPLGSTKRWLVRLNKPGVGVVTKAQMVDYYAQILAKVLRNEKDAQMCIYHVSWQSNFGFCCELDEECARELAEIPGVLSVQPDENYESEIKDYAGSNFQEATDSAISAEANQSSPIRTKKLFVAGLSFYTSEKTLRAAFESFGELVEVKIIMDKISKRSKGYAFVEYTTEEAASAALKEMNGKIINGWMIVVDVAKTSPPQYKRGRPR